MKPEKNKSSARPPAKPEVDIISDAMLDWLQRNEPYLSIRSIERHLEMSQGTISKYLKGIRPLPAQWKMPLVNWLYEFRKGFNSDANKPRPKNRTNG